MIRAADLKDNGKPGWRVRENITLDMICERLEEINDAEYGLPIQIYGDRVKSGGFLNSSTEGCLVLENEEHPDDYFKFCITTRKQRKFTIIIMNYYGSSTLTGKVNQAEERRANGSLSGLILNVFSRVNEAEYKAEYDYYDMVDSMFERLFG